MDNTIATVTNVSKIKTLKESMPLLKKDQKQFLEDVKLGLSTQPKSLPCKYFYDKKGSELFEKICQLEEYYITRTELALLEDINTELAKMIGKNATIIEPGAGAGIKIQTLFSALNSPKCYVPMDISKDFLFYSAEVIQNRFPDIQIMPIQGDFTQPVKWLEKKEQSQKVVFFPGSTIGNFEKHSAIEFLKNMHELIGNNGALIIGADLIKEPQVLEAAYDDRLGVTAEFNKNILARINTELDANFKLEQFSHKAYFNQQEQRIEMHLVSKINQTVNIGSETILFSKGESIHTENSHKYSIESFLQMANLAGFKSLKTWTDSEQLFSVHYLVHK